MEKDKPTLIESSDIRRAGSSSLTVTLTHAFRELGLDVGDFVKIITFPDRIVITRDKDRPPGKRRVVFNIDPELADKFDGDIEEAIKLYNALTEDNLWEIFKKVVREHEDQSKEEILRKLIDNYISKWTKWYRFLDRPLLKV